MFDRAHTVMKLRERSMQWFHGRECHPEPDEIGTMISLLQKVLLPNYFGSTRQEVMTDAMNALHDVMSAQIHRALFQKCLRTDATPTTRTEAGLRTDAVLTKLIDVQERLYEDVLETYHSDPAASGFDEILLTYPGLFALLVYRMAHVMFLNEIPLLPRMMTEYAHSLTGIDIHPGAQLGRGIMIDHGTGIVVGETAIVGDHVKIYQGVTLGALYFPRDEDGSMVRKTRRHPTVEDYVVLYANSTVLGGETVIGHHSVVGSNAWITSSIPPHSRVLYQTESIVRTRES